MDFKKENTKELKKWLVIDSEDNILEDYDSLREAEDARDELPAPNYVVANLDTI